MITRPRRRACLAELFLCGAAMAFSVNALAFVTNQNASLVLGQPSFTSNTGATTQSGMYGPQGVSFDSSGNLWVADDVDSRVLEFKPPFSNGMNASLVLGQSNFTSNTGATTQNGLGQPYGISFDSSGNLWVVDWGNNRVLEFVPPFSNGMNASLVLGQSNFTSSGYATTQSGMSSPWGVSSDSSGNLWVVDFGNSRVLEFQPPFSNGMNASLVLGQSNFTSYAGVTTQSEMHGPSGVSVSFDSSGNLWVADGGNNRVLEFVPPFSNGMNASLVLGQSNFTSSGYATTQSEMKSPGGVSFDSSGNLWVADYYNNRVLEFIPPFSNGMNASLVLGQSNFTSSGTATTQNGMHYPTGVSFDSSGNLWMGDIGNDRVLEFVSPPPTPSGLATAVVGISSIAWTWNSVSGATSYNFYPSTGGSAISLSGTNLTQTGLSTNTSYGGSVAALNANGESTLSPTISTYTLAAAPINFALVQVAISSITVSWGANGNPTGTSYAVEYWQVGGATSTINTTTAQATITGLKSDTSYDLTVNALNGDGVIAPSGIVLSTMTLYVPPAPSGLAATVVGISSIAWTWNSVSGATSYNFYPSTGGSAISLSGTSLTQTGLSTNTSYGGSVAALNANGESTLSPTISTYTLAATPINFALVQVAISSITVSWGANGNPTGTSYAVEYWQAGGSTSTINTTTAQETITGLKSDTSYYLTVNALNGDGVIAPSGIVLSTTSLYVPPVPSGLATAVVGISSIAWTWNSVSGATSYNFYPSTGGPAISLSGTSLTQTGLSTNTSYGGSVTALDTNEESALSPTISTYTLAATPINFALVQVAISSITVSWGANGNPTGTSYAVEYWQAGGSTSSFTTTVTQQALTSLSPDTTYYVTANALNGDGAATPSGLIVSTITRPSAPSGLVSTTLGASSIVWTWNSQSNDLSYDFYPSMGGPSINTMATSLVQIGLATNTAYGAQIAGINVSGEGDLSTVVSTYTLAAPPTNFDFVNVGTSSINVSWNSNGNPASTTSYRVDYWQAGGSTTSLTTTVTQEFITGLTLAGTYYVSLSALNGDGAATPSGITLSTQTLLLPFPATTLITSTGAMISYQGDWGQDTLQIPAQAYSQNVLATLQTPNFSSLSCPPSSAESLTPTNAGLEILLNPDIEPSGTVILTMSYQNANLGTLNPSSLLIARCDTSSNQWVPLPSTVDNINKSVIARSDHLSVFEIMGAAPPTSVSQFKVGPNPLRPALGQYQMKFLSPPNSQIRIYTVLGNLVKDITVASDGTASWDATNRSGTPVASGVYFAYVSGGGQSHTFKLIVER